jgi:hypothetical protein
VKGAKIMNPKMFCFECTREYYSGKVETFYVSAPSEEKARSKAIKENPKCYVKVIRKVF